MIAVQDEDICILSVTYFVVIENQGCKGCSPVFPIFLYYYDIMRYHICFISLLNSICTKCFIKAKNDGGKWQSTSLVEAFLELS